jgi:hypothetical protein
MGDALSTAPMAADGLTGKSLLGADSLEARGTAVLLGPNGLSHLRIRGEPMSAEIIQFPQRAVIEWPEPEDSLRQGFIRARERREAHRRRIGFALCVAYLIVAFGIIAWVQTLP